MKHTNNKNRERPAKDKDQTRRVGADGFESSRAGGIAVAVLGICAVMAPADSVSAAEWTAQATIGAGVGRDDNPTLTPQSNDTVDIIYVSPRARIEGATETAELKLDLGVNSTNYSGDTVKDTREERFEMSSFWQASERSQLMLDGELRREFLYQSVALDSGTGDLRNVDVGSAQTKVRRDALVGSPSFSYALSELSSVRVGYRSDDVKFRDAEGTGLVDFKQNDVSVEYSRQLGPQDGVSVSGGSSAYRPESGDEGDDADTRRLLIGWAHNFSETASGRVSVGRNWTTQKTDTGDVDTSGFAAEIGATQRSELTTLEAVLSRDVQPSGAGRAVESSQFRVDLRRKLSLFTDFGLRAQAFRNQVLEGSDPDVDRRYVELAPEFRWQFAPDWAASIAYAYRRQKYDEQPDAAESKAVFIGMAYASRRFGASR